VIIDGDYKSVCDRSWVNGYSNSNATAQCWFQGERFRHNKKESFRFDSSWVTSSGLSERCDERGRTDPFVTDTSTVPPHETRVMATKLARRGIHWMDAPISGSSSQASLGNMVFMVGGERSVFEKVKPVLNRIGKKTVYVGKNGDAAMLKLVVNHTLYLNQAAAIEGLVLGVKAGVNPEIMLDVLTSGAAASDLISSRGKNMLNGNFKPTGSVDIAVKDLALSLDYARRLGVMLPVGALYNQLLLKAYYNGWGRSDATVVMRIYAEMAGIAGRYGKSHGWRRAGK